MMAQLDLFSAGGAGRPAREPKQPSPRQQAASEQARQLERVGASIDEAVLGFCRTRNGQLFRGAELADWVRARSCAVPDSAGRILRKLRKEGRLAYSLVDRAGSLYRVDSVERAGARRGGAA